MVYLLGSALDYSMRRILRWAVACCDVSMECWSSLGFWVVIVDVKLLVLGWVDVLCWQYLLQFLLFCIHRNKQICRRYSTKNCKCCNALGRWVLLGADGYPNLSVELWSFADCWVMLVDVVVLMLTWIGVLCLAVTYSSFRCFISIGQSKFVAKNSLRNCKVQCVITYENFSRLRSGGVRSSTQENLCSNCNIAQLIGGEMRK